LALIHADQAGGTAALRKSFDQGVNYFDVAPAYGNGEAEAKMGVGLQGLDRHGYFLACKTKKRDAAGAQAELERSLGLLKTDYFDLYQLHYLRSVKEVKEALGPGGALEAIQKAKEAGKVKYIGFSAHTTKGALEAMRGFRFDTVMFPINYIEFFVRGFGKEVLALAQEQGAAVLAIKPMCGGDWPADVKRTREWWYRPLESKEDIGLALRWAWAQPGVVAGFPPAFLDLLERAIEAGKACRLNTEKEDAVLKEMAMKGAPIFQRDEAVAASGTPAAPVFPESPHECGCGHMA
jgi:predicted aldo/keto reductase-like oxidoreductase